MEYKHPQFDESVNVTKSYPLKDFVVYLLAVFAIVAMVYCFSVYAVRLAIPYVGQDTEQWLWDSFLKEKYWLEQSERGPEAIATEKYLQLLLDRIALQQGLEIKPQVIVMEDEEVNAMALPSGKIIVYQGLLDRLSSENAIVFVLGHELGHFANRDHLRGMGAALIMGLVLTPVLSAESGISELFGQMTTGFQNHFSRQQEKAADAYGLKVLNGIYGHAGGATEFFNAMQGEEILMLDYLSTHPVSKDRIRHIQRLIERQGLEVRDVRLKEGPH